MTLRGAALSRASRRTGRHAVERRGRAQEAAGEPGGDGRSGQLPGRRRVHGSPEQDGRGHHDQSRASLIVESSTVVSTTAPSQSPGTLPAMRPAARRGFASDRKRYATEIRVMQATARLAVTTKGKGKPSKQQQRRGDERVPEAGYAPEKSGRGDDESAREQVHRSGGHGRAQASRLSITISDTSVGVRPTRTPAASSASALAAAVPFDPDTIAPAWPMVFPGGAVNPAM